MPRQRSYQRERTQTEAAVQERIQKRKAAAVKVSPTANVVMDAALSKKKDKSKRTVACFFFFLLKTQWIDIRKKKSAFNFLKFKKNCQLGCHSFLLQELNYLSGWGTSYNSVTDITFTS